MIQIVSTQLAAWRWLSWFLAANTANNANNGNSNERAHDVNVGEPEGGWPLNFLGDVVAVTSSRPLNLLYLEIANSCLLQYSLSVSYIPLNVMLRTGKLQFVIFIFTSKTDRN